MGEEFNKALFLLEQVEERSADHLLLLAVRRVAVGLEELQKVRVGEYIESSWVLRVNRSSYVDEVVGEHGFSRWVILNLSEKLSQKWTQSFLRPGSDTERVD